MVLGGHAGLCVCVCVFGCACHHLPTSDYGWDTWGANGGCRHWEDGGAGSQQGDQLPGAPDTSHAGCVSANVPWVRLFPSSPQSCSPFLSRDTPLETLQPLEANSQYRSPTGLAQVSEPLVCRAIPFSHDWKALHPQP